MTGRMWASAIPDDDRPRDLRPADHDEAVDLDDVIETDEVVETDEIEGGWEHYDLSRSRPAVPVRLEDPSVVVAKAAGLMLATWRLDRGMSQSRAAARLGMEQTRLSRLERGKLEVSVELLSRLASLTGSDVSIRIAPDRARSPVRRMVTTGRTGRVRVQLVVDGPEQRGVDLRSRGPIF